MKNTKRKHRLTHDVCATFQILENWKKMELEMQVQFNSKQEYQRLTETSATEESLCTAELLQVEAKSGISTTMHYGVTSQNNNRKKTF